MEAMQGATPVTFLLCLGVLIVGMSGLWLLTSLAERKLKQPPSQVERQPKQPHPAGKAAALRVALPLTNDSSCATLPAEKDEAASLER
jgi:uncharacterized iron-regulated membrane protein